MRYYLIAHGIDERPKYIAVHDGRFLRWVVKEGLALRFARAEDADAMIGVIRRHGLADLKPDMRSVERITEGEPE